MFYGDVSELVWQNGHLSQVNFGLHREQPVVHEQLLFASPLLDNPEGFKNVGAATPCGERPVAPLGSDYSCADGKNDASSEVLRLNNYDKEFVRRHHEKAESAWSRRDSNEISSVSEHQVEDEDEAATRSCKLSPKRKRNSEEHRLFEKRRRKKINEKLKALHSLIPNGRVEVAKAYLLDQVITHIKALQRHLQTMNMYRSMAPMAIPVEWGGMQMNPFHHVMGAAMDPSSLGFLAHGASSVGPFMAPPPVMFPMASFQPAFHPSQY